MFPQLHDSVSEALVDHDLDFEFHETDDSAGATQEYDTNIMGRFVCNNQSCGTSGWSSKKVAITIRMYPGQEYNARVYFQRCKQCNALSEPILNETYAERVSYRLKRWRGIQVQPPPFSDAISGPHNSDLCEGCRAGHCSRSRIDDLSWQL